eukprot:11176218-Lingulodinium_polyedra.AAC.1
MVRENYCPPAQFEPDTPTCTKRIVNGARLIAPRGLRGPLATGSPDLSCDRGPGGCTKQNRASNPATWAVGGHKFT